MALSKLSGDEQGILFVQLCNVLDPGVAVALSSVSNELRTATRVPLQQLKTDHEAAAALCHKLGLRNCKELRAGLAPTATRGCGQGISVHRHGTSPAAALNNRAPSTGQWQSRCGSRCSSRRSSRRSSSAALC